MNITVYCSARRKAIEDYGADVAEIGKYIGSKGHTLVYGGVDFGLMHVAAEAVAEAGGKVVGVLPERRRLDECPFNTVTLHVPNLTERKQQMIEMGECFLVLPGGYGTLDELFATFAELNFNFDKRRKIVIYNPDGIFDHIIGQLSAMGEHQLFDISHMDRLVVADDAQNCINALENISQEYENEEK